MKSKGFTESDLLKEKRVKHGDMFSLQKWLCVQIHMMKYYGNCIRKKNENNMKIFFIFRFSTFSTLENNIYSCKKLTALMLNTLQKII